MNLQLRIAWYGLAVGGNRLHRPTKPTEREVPSGVDHEVAERPSGIGHPARRDWWHADVAGGDLEVILVPEEYPVGFLNLWDPAGWNAGRSTVKAVLHG